MKLKLTTLMNKELWELSFMYPLKCGFIMCSSRIIKI